MMNNRADCTNRHQNGNCLTLGGFCTAVPDEYCKMSQELEAYRAIAPLEEVQELVKAKQEGRLEIITQRQKEARDYLRDYSAEDRYFDDEYD